jgi:hypothetical protein
VSKAKKPKRQRLLIEGEVSGKARQRRPLDAEAFRDFCSHIATGNSLRSWAEQEGWGYSTVAEWVLRDEDRNREYRKARQMQADAHIDQLIELSDSPVPIDDQGRTDSAAVNQLRLRVDTRKWIASKYHPGLYGERLEVAGSFKAEEVPPDEIMKRIVGILAAHGLKVVPDKPSNEP